MDKTHREWFTDFSQGTNRDAKQGQWGHCDTRNRERERSAQETVRNRAHGLVWQEIRLNTGDEKTRFLKVYDILWVLGDLNHKHLVKNFFFFLNLNEKSYMHMNITYTFIEVFVFHYLLSWISHKSYTFVIFCFDLWILKCTTLISAELIKGYLRDLYSKSWIQSKTFRLKSCTERRILRVCHRSSVSECIGAAFSFLQSDGEPQSLLTSSAGREEGHRDLLNIHSTLHSAGE